MSSAAGRVSCRTQMKSFVALLLTASMLSGCRALGLTSRVLWRVPAPDGRLVAVCQEIPMLDGPGFDIRVERLDGSLLRRLCQLGDGDPCSEMAWSPDGRILAILSGHLARVRFVDVVSALERSSAPTPQWSSRQVDFSTERELLLGKSLRFVAPREIELTTCSYSLRETQRTGSRRCDSDEIHRRVRVPRPIS